MDEGNGNHGDSQPPKSVLILEFRAPGSAEFAVHSENVSPAQILTAAAWLDWFARKQFDTAAKPGIAVPSLIVPGH